MGKNPVHFSIFHSGVDRLDTHIYLGVEEETAVHASRPQRTGMRVGMGTLGSKLFSLPLPPTGPSPVAKTHSKGEVKSL